MSEYTAEMTELYTAEPETEPHIVIAKDKTVVVPEELRAIATQFEKNIETVTFDCPRYWDEHDLSTMRMYINFRRADGVELPHLCGAPTVDEADENIVHFDWTVGDDVTAIKGKLSFVAVAKKADEDGVLENRWASRLCQDMEILEGIEPNYAEILEPSADIIEQLLYKLDTATTVAVDAAERAIAAAQNVTVVNPNLIDNWYLADPVNQRGQTEYGTPGYTIDRWKQDDGTLAINDGYVTHTPNEWWNALYQPIDTKIIDALIGRKVTLSVLARSAVYDNDVRIALYDMTANHLEETFASVKTYGDLEVLAATFTVPESFAGHSVAAHFAFSTNFGGAGGSVDIVAVKLEIGDKQTLAHQNASGSWVLNEIPDKGMELIKCQRYQKKVFIRSLKPETVGTQTLNFAINDVFSDMRATPAVTLVGEQMESASGASDGKMGIIPKGNGNTGWHISAGTTYQVVLRNKSAIIKAAIPETAFVVSVAGGTDYVLLCGEGVHLFLDANL